MVNTPSQPPAHGFESKLLSSLERVFATLDEGRLVEYLVREVRSIFDGVSASLILPRVGDRLDDLYIAFSDVVMAEAKSPIGQKVGDGVAKRVAQTGKSALLVDDSAATDARFGDLKRRPRGSSMICPIVNGGFLGVLTVNRNADQTNFEALDLRHMEVFSVYVGLALENMGLHRSLEKAAVRATKDLANLQRMELELRLSQKLEAVGQLAAGIAHEINTPIQFMGDSARFLESAIPDMLSLCGLYKGTLNDLVQKVPDSSALQQTLDNAEEEASFAYTEKQAPKAIARILDGVQRVATIVEAMREFGLVDQRDMSGVDLNRAIATTVVVAQAEYNYVAELTTDLQPLPLVQCRVGELNQVFLNLILNAAQAIAATVGNSGVKGKISISTRVQGEEVLVTVTDTGGGIPDSVQARIFEPFFTTREVGKGMGQGLAIARSIVVQGHHGRIHFETAQGEGTQFFVTLPIRQPL